MNEARTKRRQKIRYEDGNRAGELKKERGGRGEDAKGAEVGARQGIKVGRATKRKFMTVKSV